MVAGVEPSQMVSLLEITPAVILLTTTATVSEIVSLQPNPVAETITLYHLSSVSAGVVYEFVVPPEPLVTSLNEYGESDIETCH